MIVTAMRVPIAITSGRIVITSIERMWLMSSVPRDIICPVWAVSWNEKESRCRWTYSSLRRSKATR
jgi:hypothetical protein